MLCCVRIKNQNFRRKYQMITTSPYKGCGSITREQFLFYETRTTAKLLNEGLNDDEVINQIVSDNLFQYPTEKSVKVVARGCIRRLKALNDPELIRAIANEPSEVAKQICLYAMMKQYRLVWDFMITVIGNKFSQRSLRLILKISRTNYFCFGRKISLKLF